MFKQSIPTRGVVRLARAVLPVRFSLKPEKSLKADGFPLSFKLGNFGLQSGSGALVGAKEIFSIGPLRCSKIEPLINRHTRLTLAHDGRIGEASGGSQRCLDTRAKLEGADIVHAVPRPSGIGLAGGDEQIDNLATSDITRLHGKVDYRAG